MQKLHHMANIIVLTRDYYGGRVTTDRAGNPVLHYRLHRYDARHLMKGLLEALRVHRAAGALEVSAPHNAHLAFNSQRDKDFEGFLEEVQGRGFKPNAYALFSAHQMSSCRIGGNTALGAVDPTGETYEVKNLFVADGSVLPTASGVNPMVTIMGTAHYLAQQMKSKL
jgi:choline dehydrogenase-like flavoprotein